MNVKCFSYNLFFSRLVLRATFYHLCDNFYMHSKPHKLLIFHWFGFEFVLNIQETLG